MSIEKRPVDVASAAGFSVHLFTASGGAVAVAGTMLGALLVTTIRSGLLVLQIGNYWLQLYLGVILLLAVLVDRYRALYQERRGIPMR